jgi:hypothetical protein
VFFRFSHRNQDGKALKNKEQSSIVEVIKEDVTRKQEIYGGADDTKSKDKVNSEVEEDIDGKQENTKEQNEESKDNAHQYQSTTYIPYYDKILREDFDLDEEYELIGDSKEAYIFGRSEESEAKIYAVKNSFVTKPLRLPRYENHNRFMPTCSGKSSIMNDTQIMIIARLLPPLYRLREWTKAYSIDEDGISLQTFYKNAKGYANNILFIEDGNGFKFGAYLCEEWTAQKYFYGTGESYLFTFRDTEEDVEFYKWSSYNDHIQYSDDSSIAIGGADGKFALYLRNNFLDGMSNQCKTFDNEILSSGEDFQCRRLELWGFEH